ncbi:MAG: sensor domain-containing diguanylate cyclase [Candidatus Omnitrophota bacterium]|nr:sensor domain-containing diguanylate cyclase [Candidatus Omnitrophota bacterium]
MYKITATLFVSGISVLFLVLVFRKLREHVFAGFHGKLDELEEQVNLLTEAIGEKKKALKILPSRCAKISFLFKTSKHLVEVYDPDEVFKFLIKCSKRLFPETDNILLFILRKEEDSLELVRSSKGQNIVIEEKQGDILDKWVLRHNNSLLVKEIKSDFRFDYNKVIPFIKRKMVSFMASPLSVGDKVIGVMRLESESFSTFSMEDLRILRSICDLGAVVLERANLFKRTQELAIRDSLTGLFLRNYFFDRLKEEIKRASVRSSSIGLIMVDIDDFKKINDTYGHVVGDLVLKKLAKLLREVVGDVGNVISRFGGEEFIIFFVECSKSGLFDMAQQIRRLVEEEVITFRRKAIGFTISAGVAFYPQDGNNSIELVETVDKRLYKAKKEGKNRVCDR